MNPTRDGRWLFSPRAVPIYPENRGRPLRFTRPEASVAPRPLLEHWLATLFPLLLLQTRRGKSADQICRNGAPPATARRFSLLFVLASPQRCKCRGCDVSHHHWATSLRAHHFTSWQQCDPLSADPLVNVVTVFNRGLLAPWLVHMSVAGSGRGKDTIAS